MLPFLFLFDVLSFHSAVIELTCRASVGKYEEMDTEEGVRRKRKEEKTGSNEQELHPLCTRPRKGKEKRYSRWEENAEPDEMRTMKIVKMLIKYKTGNREVKMCFLVARFFVYSRVR